MSKKKLTRAEQLERQAEAVRLRGLGHTYDQIAAQLEFADASGAYRAVDRAYAGRLRETTQHTRLLELDRLDTLLRAAFEILAKDHVHVSGGRVVRAEVYATNPETGRVLMETDENGQPRPVIERYDDLYNDKPKLDAVKTILKIMERRAKYLGLDAPTGGDPVHPDLIRAEMEQLAAELGVDPSAFDADLAALLDRAQQEE